VRGADDKFMAMPGLALRAKLWLARKPSLSKRALPRCSQRKTVVPEDAYYLRIGARDDLQRTAISLTVSSAILALAEERMTELQVAKDNGAKRSLIPIDNKRNFLDVSADIMEHVDPVFYGDPRTAALKVVGNGRQPRGDTLPKRDRLRIRSRAPSARRSTMLHS
jgi:hypothetical protein